MNILCIRGATTVDKNTKENILDATKELLQKIIEVNNLSLEQIIFIIFTATKDLDEVYPAVAARDMGITNASLMCTQEMHVKGSLPMCIRVMIQIQTNKLQNKTKHIYLNEAKILRPDLNQELM